MCGPESFPGNLIPSFDVQVRWRTTGVVVLELSGEVDLVSGPPVIELIRRELAAGPRSLVVELAGVTFCSASGIATLVEMRRLARACGVGLHFSHPSHRVRRVVDLTGCHELLAGDGVPTRDA